MSAPRTMYRKIWDAHVAHSEPGKPDLLYVDLHLIHELHPHEFDALREAGRRVRRPELTVATVDHNVPTTDRALPITDDMARAQIEAMERNSAEFGVEFHGLDSPGQGIVHVIGPEQGYTQPGMVIVCGDSHTSTHGAFGALAFGIGSSQVEHVLALQSIPQTPSPVMQVRVEGALGRGVTPKDLILAIIGEIGIDGATGHVIEYTGSAIRGLSMEGRMTVCNMSIEAGARAGMIAPDETTFAYLEGRPRAPQGRDFASAVERWRELPSDKGAPFDRTVEIDASALAPYVTWGTNPGMSTPVTGNVPNPDSLPSEAERKAARAALAYMGLEGGEPIRELAIDRAFIGSCTNGRIEDLRAAAEVARGRRIAPSVRAMIVPGSTMVKQQAEGEGLDRVFIDAGFEWRNAGCSMCVAMNGDMLAPGERCASTTNRNFEGRQGRGGRTHLVSPAMAAAAAIAGHFVDIRDWA